MGWWELRRIPYNLIVLVFGAFSYAIFATSIDSRGHLQPDQDAVEPFALFLIPVAANLAYTAGWLVDAPLRRLCPTLRPVFTPFLFWIGLAFSFFVISIPAVLWGSYRLLQLLHVAR